MSTKVTTAWKEGMLFESVNPTGDSLYINDGTQMSDKDVYSPKALMLSSLAGCSGLDVVSLFKKMKLEVGEFRIDIKSELTDEHPRFYDKTRVEYHFHGSNLHEEKLQKCVNLSVERYCGVMEMFRRFSEMEIVTVFHHSN